MHDRLPRALSRLSSSEPVAVVRVSRDLPGLHPLLLHRLRAGMTVATDVSFSLTSVPDMVAVTPAQTACGPGLTFCVTRTKAGDRHFGPQKEIPSIGLPVARHRRRGRRRS